jgi:putative transposase
MLKNPQFQDWCQRLDLSQHTSEFVHQIRTSDPVRRVGGRTNNVCGRYPSQKMGRTIQFESHKIELPAIEDYEADDDVLEYYDQPFRLTLSYVSKSGRHVVCSHVPDFFVIRQSSVGFEEWKPEAKLKALADRQPHRYHQNADGTWSSPAAEQGVAAFGVSYQLRSDREINWTLYRNRQFLRSYVNQGYCVTEEITRSLQATVVAHPGITLLELIQAVSESSMDDINALIATRQLYVDLEQEPLAEPDRVHLFENAAIAQAYAIVVPCPIAATTGNLQILEIATGTELLWDGKPLMILQKGITQIVLRGEQDLIHLSYDEFNYLVQQGHITPLHIADPPSRQAEIWSQINRASPSDLAIANHRYAQIEPYLQRQTADNGDMSERTLRDWKAKFRAAQELYGWGYLGLLPHHTAKGNRQSRLSPEQEKLLDQIIEQHYETLKQRGQLAVYGILLREWEKAGFGSPVPSRTTFALRIKHRSGVQQTRQRQGQRAAYPQTVVYHELTQTTPRHGDRPFEICHVDHTELDIELVCVRTGRSLGRPWATVLLDAFSRRILAIYLSFERPSYRACMMVLRSCVQRFGQFPETLVVDNGAEFGSVYFETLLAAFECTKKQRPAASPRFGSLIERLFGTSHTEFFYNLRGNTQITKHVRLMTQSNNPKHLAVWTLAELFDRFCEYAYDIYDQRAHPALGRSPRATFLSSMAQSGSRRQRHIVYDENFQIFTLPSTLKGTAKVRAREGIKINYVNYWSIDDSFLQPGVEGSQVPVRYDPFDMGTAYAYVNGQWVRCISEHYALLHGRSELEVRYASIELRRQQQLHSHQVSLRAKEIALYLESTEAQEALQLQRLHDLAIADVHQGLEQDQHFSLPDTSRPTPIEPLSTIVPFDPPSLPQAFSSIQPYGQEELW